MDTAELNPILVVEDDDDCRAVLATLLTVMNYRVVTAANGVEGLTEARRSHPCLILLDLMMPVMDGEQFRREQLLDPAIARIPVVLVSGTYNAAQRARSLGAVCSVAKPIVFRDLHRQITEFCHAHLGITAPTPASEVTRH